MDINLNWTDFKQFLADKSLIPNYFTIGDTYHLLAFDGPLVVKTKIVKETVAEIGSDQEDFEDNYKSSSNKKDTITNSPFASKNLPNGKSLYKRVVGVKSTVDSTLVNIDYTIPYTECKITGVQIIGAELGDKASFQILDTITGTLTTVPSYKLNEFGTDVYMVSGLHDFSSNYDADLFVGLQVRVAYTPKAGLGSRDIYCNIILHEVK